MGKVVRMSVERGARAPAVVEAREAWAAFRERGEGTLCPDLTPSIGERAMASLVAAHGQRATWDHFDARAFDAHLARALPVLSEKERFVMVGSMPMFLAFLAREGKVAPEVVDRAFADCDLINPWA